MADEKKNPETAGNDGVEILTKLTPKGLGCKPERAKIDEKDVPMFRIMGIATDVVVKPGTNGEPTMGAKGNFEAVNLETGKTYQSGIAYLPGGIMELITGPLLTAKENGDVLEMAFAFDVIAYPAKNPIGYSWKAKPLVKPAENDPLAKLRDAVTAALPAPTANKKAVDNKGAAA